MVKSFIHIVFVFFLIANLNLSAQTPVANATTDSAEYKVGDYITYILNLEYEQNQNLIIPSVKDSITTLEYIKELPAEKYEVDGKIKEVRKYIFSKYDSTEVTTPPFIIDYTIEGDPLPKAVRVNPVTLLVRTLDVNSEEDIRDVKDPQTIPFNWLFWGIILLIVLIVALAAYLVVRHYLKKNALKHPEKVLVKVPPHKIALSALHALESKKLWQQGKIKEYHSEITEIIRRYFEARFGFLALEMTSNEILENLKMHSNSNLLINVEEFFSNADLVKFAKFIPMPSVNEEMMKQAYQIVESTMLKEELLEAEDTNV